MGAKAPIFTRSLWSFRSFCWGDHSDHSGGAHKLLTFVDLRAQPSDSRPRIADFDPEPQPSEGKHTSSLFCAHRILAFHLRARMQLEDRAANFLPSHK